MTRWPVRDVPEAEDYRRTGIWQGRTIADLAWRLAEQDDGSQVFLNEEQPSSITALVAEAEILLSGLQDRGIANGDVVSFMVPNWREAAVINLAAAMGGLVINPIVPIYRDAETLQILSDCRSKAIFIPTTFRKFDYAAMMERLRPHLPDLRHVILVRDETGGANSYAALIAEGRASRPKITKVDPGSVKMVMYTSGTTGKPKAVLHSHETLERAVVASAEHWNLAPGDIVFMPSPVTHISGYSNGLERPFISGTRTILMDNWNAQEAVRQIDRHGAVMTVAATPFLQELITAAKQAGSRIPSFRIFACGGAAVPSELIRRADEVFAQACAFRVYGSSEAPFVTLGFIEPQLRELAATTDGRIVDYDVRILTPDDSILTPGQEGEIVVRGPALFLGYADPLQTAESFTSDGYFRTGDIGKVVENNGIVITDRKKDIIIRGGENISAKEIEDALHQHDSVLEAAVVAMPHERLGEGVCAFIVAAEGASPSVSVISDFLEKLGLARQKHPERVELVPELPRTASGKVRKDILRAKIL